MKTKQYRSYQLIGVTLLVGIGLLLSLANLVRAQVTAVTPTAPLNTIQVNTDSDSDTADAFCSLREAIIAANTDAAYNGCPAGSNADTITFAADYTITLDGSQLPAITEDVTITGNGPANTIIQASTCDPTDSGSTCSHDYRVMEVAASTVLLEGLTIRHGNRTVSGFLRGGGIFVNVAGVDLTLDNVLVTKNYAGQSGGGIGFGNGDDGDLTLQNGSAIEGNESPNAGAGVYFSSDGLLLIDNSSVSYNYGSRGAGIYVSTDNSTAEIRNDSKIDGNQTEGSTYDGGGIYLEDANQSLTIDNSSVSDNTASRAGGAIYLVLNPLNTVIIRNNSNIENNEAGSDGGGIFYSDGSVTVSDSTFLDNRAPNGGGGAIVNSGATLTVTNSTFAGNIATGASGGGIDNEGVLTVSNSTFYNNNSNYGGGGIVNQSSGTATLVNNTFSDNEADDGDGVWNLGMLHIMNNIIANQFSSNSNCYNTGTIGTDINNLIEGNAPGAQACGTPISTADPNLGPLQDNGGATQTMALLPGSPAIDAGDDTVCAASPVNNLDQRGLTRPQGTHCDIGAYEVEPTQTGPDFVVNTNADTDDGFCDLLGQGVGNQDCTLREAINAANSNADTSEITFAANYTITLTSALPDITTDVIIDGNGATNTIVQASACDPVTLPGGCTPADWRVFTFDDEPATLKDLTARYGNCAGVCSLSASNGGNIYATFSDLTLDAVNVQSGYSSGDGGGIYSVNSSLTIQNNSLIGGLGTGNKADIDNDSYAGGVFFVDGGTLLVDNSEVSYNMAGSYGGGIHAQNGTFIIQNGSLIDNNQSQDDTGGGINAEGTGCQLTIDASTISNNTMAHLSSAPKGGGLWTTCETTLNASTISGNSLADGDGGGIYISSNAVVTVTNSTIYSNTADNIGGGLYLQSGVILTVTHSNIYSNTANQAGGIYMNSSSVVNLSDSSVNANKGQATDTDGGGISNNGGSLSLTNVTMTHNEAGRQGGAISNSSSGQVTIANSNIYSNTAGTFGGAIVSNGQLSIDNSRIADNWANSSGGAMHLSPSSTSVTTITHSAITGNSADDIGGISHAGGQTTIINTTVSQNIARSNDTGGIKSWAGALTATLTNTTIVSNTRIGLNRSVGIMSIYNSIIAYNSGNECAGTGINSGGYNLASDSSCSFLTATGDITNTNPLLSPLSDNGGDTETHALYPDSPALDAIPGGNCTLSTDQRGVSRPYGAACDIGAFESQGFALVFSLTGGDNQSTEVDTAFANPLQVTLVDSNTNQAIPERVITFTGPNSGAGIAPTVITATTDSNGVASVIPTANSETGSYEMVATADLATDPVTFTLQNYTFYTLTTTTDGNGSGSVTAGGVYTNGTEVMITATANTGSYFLGWYGDATGTTNPLTVAMDSDKDIIAGFDLLTYTLSIATDGNGSGLVTADPDQATYEYGAVVTLTASADFDSRFASWSGDASGSTNPVTLTITADSVVTATFDLQTFTLSLNTDGNGSGSITANPDQATYVYGTVVTVTAVADSGSTFVGWSGACTNTTGDCVITITKATLVTATFNKTGYSLYLPLVVK